MALCLSEDTSDAAIEACNAMILDPDWGEYDVAEAFMGRGIKFQRLERHEHALNDYDKAIKLSPDQARWYLTRGTLQFLRDNVETALDDLEYAAFLAPDNADILLQHAVALDLAGWSSDAVDGYTKVIELVPDDPQVYLARAHAHAATDDFVSALADYDEVIRLDPTNPEAYNSAAWVMATYQDASVRDGAKAVRLALKAVELRDDPVYLDTLAAAYAEIEAFAQAARTQQEAIDILRANGADEEAIADFESRLSLYQNNRPHREE